MSAGNDLTLLRWIETCAAAGIPCPSNEDIRARFGFARDVSASRMMSRLAEEGAIRIVRANVGRIVEIVATGARTAPRAKLPPRWADGVVGSDPILLTPPCELPAAPVSPTVPPASLFPGQCRTTPGCTGTRLRPYPYCPACAPRAKAA